METDWKKFKFKLMEDPESGELFLMNTLSAFPKKKQQKNNNTQEPVNLKAKVTQVWTSLSQFKCYIFAIKNTIIKEKRRTWETVFYTNWSRYLRMRSYKYK